MILLVSCQSTVLSGGWCGVVYFLSFFYPPHIGLDGRACVRALRGSGLVTVGGWMDGWRTDPLSWGRKEGRMDG